MALSKLLFSSGPSFMALPGLSFALRLEIQDEKFGASSVVLRIDVRSVLDASSFALVVSFGTCKFGASLLLLFSASSCIYKRRRFQPDAGPWWWHQKFSSGWNCVPLFSWT